MNGCREERVRSVNATVIGVNNKQEGKGGGKEKKSTFTMCGPPNFSAMVAPSGIQFADQENIIIDSNILQIQPHVPK